MRTEKKRRRYDKVNKIISKICRLATVDLLNIKLNYGEIVHKVRVTENEMERLLKACNETIPKAFMIATNLNDKIMFSSKDVSNASWIFKPNELRSMIFN